MQRWSRLACAQTVRQRDSEVEKVSERPLGASNCKAHAATDIDNPKWPADCVVSGQCSAAGEFIRPKGSQKRVKVQ